MFNDQQNVLVEINSKAPVIRNGLFYKRKERLQHLKFSLCQHGYDFTIEKESITFY